MSFFTQSLIIADVAPDIGYTKDFDYCLKIVNLSKYPNHLLFARIQSPTQTKALNPYLLVKANQCISLNGYRPAAMIVAIAKQKVQRSDLKQTNSGTILENTKLEKSLIKGTPSIPRPDSLAAANQGKQVVANYQIQSLDPASLKLGAVNDSMLMSNIILFPLIGSIVLGWMIWQRNKKQTVDEL